MIRDTIRGMQKQREAALRDIPELHVKVLDKGFVELIDFMGDDDSPVDAARVSFGRRAEEFPEEKNDKLFQFLIAHHHTSPTEMVVAKFRISAPVVVWWHLVRHRMASYNFVSGRYVAFEEDQFYEVPADGWRLQSKSNKQGSSGLMPEAQGAHFTKLQREHIEKSFELYKAALDVGIAREQARLFLPFASCYYPAIVAMNARSLLNFLELRRSPDAQYEIRAYANAIHSILTLTHTRVFP